MRQILLEAPEKIRLCDVPVPKINGDEVLIRVSRVGICGSDLHAYHGAHPYISLPVVPGHEFSGQIAEMGNQAKGLVHGQRVTVEPSLVCGKCKNCTSGRYNICTELKVIGCQTTGAMADYLVVPASKVLPLPDSLSDDQGAMVEPLAVGVHAVHKAELQPGYNGLILGAGTIGLMTMQAARALGAGKIIISDLLDERLDLARELGADVVVNPEKQDLDEVLQTHFGTDRADVIFECVGHPASIQTAIQFARKGSRIILAGVFGKSVLLDVGLIQDRELELVGTLMYANEDFPTAIKLIADGKVNVDAMITDHFGLDDAARAYQKADARHGVMKVMLDVN